MTVEIDVKFDRAINEETIPASTAEAVLGGLPCVPTIVNTRGTGNHTTY